MRCPPYRPGVDVCLDCPYDGDKCPNWTPWGDTFDTVRAPAEIIAAKAVIKEVGRVRKAHAKMAAKGKVSKAGVNLGRLAKKTGLSALALAGAAHAVMLEPGITVQKLSSAIK